MISTKMTYKAVAKACWYSIFNQHTTFYGMILAQFAVEPSSGANLNISLWLAPKERVAD